MRTRALILALVAATAATSFSAQARAQAPAADDLAQRFVAAQRAFEDKRFEEALAAFQPLAEETKSPNAMLYVARSLRELDRIPEAHDAMRAAVREATARATGEEKYAATRDAAAAELALLAPRVGFVVVALADVPDGASVSLDGVPLPAERLGTPVTVLPGDHAVEMVAAGSPPVRREVAVGPTEVKTVALTGPAAPAPTRPPAEPRSEGGGLRIAGLVVGGFGLATVGVGVVTGLMASGEFSELEDTCGASRCTDPAAADTIDSGKSLETIANVTLIGGGILVAAAIPMILLGGPSEAGGETAVSVTPGGGSVRWTTAF